MRLLRLVTGLVVASFVTGHFLNHALGVESIDAMDRLRAVLSAWWRSPPGTVVLYGSLLTHFALALVSLYQRTTLRMPLWEAAQLVLGLCVPPLSLAMFGTRFSWWLLGHTVGYERVVGVLWSEGGTSCASRCCSPVVWDTCALGCTTGCLKRWYPAVQPLAFAAALLVPALAWPASMPPGSTSGP
jgi:adenylate cyclase